MTEYWKSQDRKFCEYCKCWITDNKPSVEFHNNGKRHQINVQKRLNEIGKKSEADKKAQDKMNEDIRKMNSAAMKSYMKDVSTGADISSRAIGHSMQASSSNRAIDPIALPYYSDEECGPNVRKASTSTAVPEKKQSMWCQARAEEGHFYYWHIKTGETTWEKPKEGYMKIDEYEKLNAIAVKQQEEKLQQEMTETIENADELAAKYKREQSKKYRKFTEDPKPKEEPLNNFADIYGTYHDRPLGEWQAVDSEPEKKEALDLELPKQDFANYYAVASVSNDEPPVKKFKEKTVTKLDDDSSPAVFKKRKFTNKNIRRAEVD